MRFDPQTKKNKARVSSRKWKTRWKRLVSTLAAITVFCTTYALILPAITVNSDTYCGIEEHEHTDKCYTLELICGLEEGQMEPGTAAVAGTSAEQGQPQGGQSQIEETEVSEPETVTQTVTEIVTETVIETEIQTIVETEIQTVIETELQEVLVDPGHTHRDSCYEEAVYTVCGQDEIESTEAVFDENGEVIEEAIEGHTHTEECYQTETALVCGEEERDPVYEEQEVAVEKEIEVEVEREIEVDVEKEVEVEVQKEIEVPAEAPVDAPETNPTEAPEKPEAEGTPHVHTEACYKEVPTCGKEEHKHTDECFSNPTLDLESAADWEKTLPGAGELTGNWAEDVLAIAKSQLGYQESPRNFQMVNNERKGYSRYGAWYGAPYSDWCAIFIQFCMNYAGVDTRLMPASAGVGNWIRNVSKMDNYFAPAGYMPQPGDIIFFDWDPIVDGIERDGDHVGLVAEVKTKEETTADGAKVQTPVSVITIEGNSSNAVKYNTYSIDDTTIIGYSRMPKKPETEEELKAIVEEIEKAEKEAEEAKAEEGETEEVEEGAEEAGTEASVEAEAEGNEAEAETNSVEPTIALVKHKDVQARLFTDGSYEEEIYWSETSVFVSGILPVVNYVNEYGEEISELAVEVRAYATDESRIKVADATAVLSYDITIFYKDEYKELVGADIFQPEATLSVSFESPILAATEDDNATTYSVYYVSENEETQLVAEESAASQVAKLQALADDSVVTVNSEDAADKTNAEYVASYAGTEEEFFDNMAASVEALAEEEAASLIINTEEAPAIGVLSAADVSEVHSGVTEVVASDVIAQVTNDGGKPEATPESASEAAPEVATNGATNLAVGELVIEQGDEVGRVTFDTDHFSEYALLKKTLDPAHDKNSKFGVTSIALKNSNGQQVSNVTDVSKVYTLEVGIQSSVNLFSNQIVAGDYFDVKLPKEFRYPSGAFDTITIGSIKAHGAIYKDDDGSSILHVTITEITQSAGNATSFSLSSQVVFDLNVVEPNSNATIKASVNGSEKSKTIQIGNFNKRQNGAVRELKNTVITNIALVPSMDEYAAGIAYGLKIDWRWDANAENPDLRAGDYFTINLPNDLDYDGTDFTAFTLSDASGAIVGTATINPENKTVRVEFTDYINTSSDYIYAIGSMTILAHRDETGVANLVASVVGGASKNSGVANFVQQIIPDGWYQSNPYTPFYEAGGYGARCDDGSSYSYSYLMIAASEWNKHQISGNDRPKDYLSQKTPWNYGKETAYDVVFCLQGHHLVWTYGSQNRPDKEKDIYYADTGRYAYEKISIDQLANNQNYTHTLEPNGTQYQYTADQVRRLKAVLSNAYPYVPLSVMNERLGTNLNEMTATAVTANAIWWVIDELNTLNIVPSYVTKGKQFLIDRDRTNDSAQQAAEAAIVKAGIQKLVAYADDATLSTSVNSRLKITELDIQKALKNADGTVSYFAKVTLNRPIKSHEVVTARLVDNKGGEGAAITVTPAMLDDDNSFGILIDGSSTDVESLKAELQVNDAYGEIDAYFYENAFAANRHQRMIGGRVEPVEYKSEKEVPVEFDYSTQVLVRKKWVGYTPSYSDYIKVTLMSDVTGTMAPVTQDKYGNAIEQITLDRSNSWSALITNLPHTKADGTPITYRFREDTYEANGTFIVSVGTPTIITSSYDMVYDGSDDYLTGRVDPDIGNSYNPYGWYNNAPAGSGTQVFIYSTTERKYRAVNDNGDSVWVNSRATAPVNNSADNIRKQLWTVYTDTNAYGQTIKTFVNVYNPSVRFQYSQYELGNMYWQYGNMLDVKFREGPGGGYSGNLDPYDGSLDEYAVVVSEDHVITNTKYDSTPQPAYLELSAAKKLLGKDGTDYSDLLTTGEYNGVFEFTLTAVGNAPMPEGAVNGSITVTNNGSGVDFGRIKFEREGTFKYKLSEKKGTIDGVTYDGTTREIEVVVKKINKEGAIKYVIASISPESAVDSEVILIDSMPAPGNTGYGNSIDHNSEGLGVNIKLDAMDAYCLDYDLAMPWKNTHYSKTDIDKVSQIEGHEEALKRILYVGYPYDSDNGEITSWIKSNLNITDSTTIAKYFLRATQLAIYEELGQSAYNSNSSVNQIKAQIKARAARVSADILDDVTLHVYTAPGTGSDWDGSGYVQKPYQPIILATIPSRAKHLTFKQAFENKIETFHDITIEKYDAFDKTKTLAGAMFGIKEADKEGAPVIILNDNNGVFTSDKILKANVIYELIELQPPTGYKPLGEKIRFSVDSHGRVTVRTSNSMVRESDDGLKIEVQNAKNPTVKLRKVDLVTKAPLAGAKFELKDKDGNVLGTYESGDDGYILLGSLASGTYSLVETEAPTGYSRITSEITITIKDDISNPVVIIGANTWKEEIETNVTAYTYTFYVGNSVGIELPETGGIGTTVIYVLGAILVVGAGVLMVARRKNKK